MEIILLRCRKWIYYIGGRYYSPETKQFLNSANPETILTNASTIYELNLYSYVNNNPVAIKYNVSTSSDISRRQILGNLNKMSIKLPSQDWVSLGIDFTAAMSGSLSVIGWTARNPEFYDFLYSAYGISKFDMLNNLKSPMNKIAGIISYGLVAYDTYSDVISHINVADSWQTTIASGVVTAGVGVFNVWASAKVGGAIGAAIGGVPGLIIGIVAGAVVGIIINGVFYTEINGKSIAGYIENGIESFLQWLF